MGILFQSREGLTHMMCPKYIWPLTPTVPMATGLLEILTFNLCSFYATTVLIINSGVSITIFNISSISLMQIIQSALWFLYSNLNDMKQNNSSRFLI